MLSLVARHRCHPHCSGRADHRGFQREEVSYGPAAGAARADPLPGRQLASPLHVRSPRSMMVLVFVFSVLLSITLSVSFSLDCDLACIFAPSTTTTHPPLSPADRCNRRFLKSVNFAGWWLTRKAAANAELSKVFLEHVQETDWVAWVAQAAHHDITTVLRRLREAIVRAGGLPCLFSLSLSLTHTHIHTHARTNAHTHTHTHTHDLTTRTEPCTKEQ